MCAAFCILLWLVPHVHLALCRAEQSRRSDVTAREVLKVDSRRTEHAVLLEVAN